jgi:hypothetical protein
VRSDAEKEKRTLIVCDRRRGGNHRRGLDEEERFVYYTNSYLLPGVRPHQRNDGRRRCCPVTPRPWRGRFGRDYGSRPRSFATWLRVRLSRRHERPCPCCFPSSRAMVSRPPSLSPRFRAGRLRCAPRASRGVRTSRNALFCFRTDANGANGRATVKRVKRRTNRYKRGNRGRTVCKRRKRLLTDDKRG